MMEERCGEGLYNSFFDEEEEEEDDGDTAVTSKVIGISEVYEELKQKVMGYTIVTSLVVMPGIGKTTLAKKIFYDPEIVECFDHRVWVRVGRKCGVIDIPRCILAEMDLDSLQTLLEGGDAELAIHEYLKMSLKSKRCLIVLDDVWDKYTAQFIDPHYRFTVYRLEHPFLHRESKSRILLTSRLQQVQCNSVFNVILMRLLKEKESWDLFCDKVFSGGSCPTRLEKTGKKISKNCEGLPLTILAIARLLSEDPEKSTPEYWNMVAGNENHQLFKEAYEEISKVLLPSYIHLPPLLQICFHFVGLFHQKYKIPRSKLINLWFADRFEELNMNPYLDSYAIEYLMELVNNNLVMVYQEGISYTKLIVKSCGLHSSLWHLSNKKAKETKFAMVLRSRDDSLGDDIKGQHRLSFHNHILFNIKDVYQFVENNYASSTQSILCYGPYHQYQIPDSISQLSNLQFFIVDQLQSIKSHKGPSYFPAEIWGMKELKHLQATGNDLPDPCGASLESLSTLLNVSSHSCTEAVLNAIPNLSKLRILIELAPDDDGKTLSCLDHVTHCCNELNILKCIIINPMAIPPIVPLTNFLPLRYLKKANFKWVGLSLGRNKQD